jgi:hypothetical protein
LVHPSVSSRWCRSFLIIKKLVYYEREKHIPMTISTGGVWAQRTSGPIYVKGTKYYIEKI